MGCTSEFPEILKHRVDHLERLVNFLTDLGASKHDLAADEDEKHDLWFDHSVDQAGEQLTQSQFSIREGGQGQGTDLRFVARERMMLAGKALQPDGKLAVATADNVLNLEVGEFCLGWVSDHSARIVSCSLR